VDREREEGGGRCAGSVLGASPQGEREVVKQNGERVDEVKEEKGEARMARLASSRGRIGEVDLLAV